MTESGCYPFEKTDVYALIKFVSEGDCTRMPTGVSPGHRRRWQRKTTSFHQ